MLFVSYWEINEEIPASDRLEAGQRLVQAGLHEPDGVRFIRWDITADGWGITIGEADNAESLIRAIDAWTSAMPGFFKSIKTSPAMPVADRMALLDETAQAVAAT